MALRSNLQERDAQLKEVEDGLEKRRLELAELQSKAKANEGEYATNVANLIAHQRAKYEMEAQRSSELVENVQDLKISVGSSCESLAKAGGFINQESTRLQGELEKAQKEAQDRTFAAGKMVGRLNESSVGYHTLRNDLQEACVVKGRLQVELEDARSAIATLELREAEMRTEITHLTNSNSSLKLKNAENADLATKNSVLEQKEVEMRMEITNLVDKISSLKLKDARMSDGINDLITKNSSLVQKETKMSKEIADLISSLELREAEMSREIEDLVDSNSSLELKQAEMDETIADIAKCNQDLTDILGSTRKEVQVKSELLHQMKKEMDDQDARSQQMLKEAQEAFRSEARKLLADSQGRVSSLSRELEEKSEASSETFRLLQEQSEKLAKTSRELEDKNKESEKASQMWLAANKKLADEVKALQKKNNKSFDLLRLPRKRQRTDEELEAETEEDKERGAWTLEVTDVANCLLRCRPAIEATSSLTRAEVAAEMSPNLMMDHNKVNITEFLSRANQEDWYCFSSMARYGIHDLEAKISPAGICEAHNRCLQVRRGLGKSGPNYLVCRMGEPRP
ncbi:hypothetical protein F4814DRAFT_460990 [Daldinia grandis]|nr:hypothetical protein F4814DRAFT_460990 [Daldinia grandis]